MCLKRRSISSSVLVLIPWLKSKRSWSTTPSNSFVFLVWEDEVLGPSFLFITTEVGLNRVDVYAFMACVCASSGGDGKICGSPGDHRSCFVMNELDSESIYRISLPLSLSHSARALKVYNNYSIDGFQFMSHFQWQYTVGGKNRRKIRGTQDCKIAPGRLKNFNFLPYFPLPSFKIRYVSMVGSLRNHPSHSDMFSELSYVMPTLEII